MEQEQPLSCTGAIERDARADMIVFMFVRQKKLNNQGVIRRKRKATLSNGIEFRNPTTS
jgi:hypothetical protein